MSDVTDIILIIAIDDGDLNGDLKNIDTINNYLISSYKSFMEKVDSFAGGNKAVQCDVYMAAINYLNKEDLISKFLDINWDYKECAQLMLKGEHDNKFKLYEIE